MFDFASLAQSKPVLLDGAWGTELQALGLPPGACPDAWNLAEPSNVERVARSYVTAGSQIILTNTFGANRVVLSRHGFSDRVGAINRAGAEISLRAAADAARVVASVGPTGKLFSMDEIGEAELAAVYGEQLTALVEAGIEAVVLETFTDLGELGVALAAAKSLGLSVVACMVFDSGAKKDRTAMGTTPEQAAERLVRGGASALGANCGRGIDAYVPICQRLRAVTSLPLWFKPNAGLPQLVDGKVTYATSAEQFAESALQLAQAGANLIGGCCGTSPAFVSSMAEALART